MHFVTGGAFHGKAKWVSDYYNIQQEDEGWIACDGIPPSLNELKGTKRAVLEGMEQVVRSVVFEKGQSAREELVQLLEFWLTWEASDRERQLILIGTDIGKGIVPMEKEKRIWRDINGWFFQDIVKRAKRVDVIWYGISQLLKGEDETR